MMTQDEVKNVGSVYRYFMASENNGWDAIDDYMDHLEYLSNDELHREVDVIYTQHKLGKPGCGKEHPTAECFINNVIDAVGSILELYKETNDMHPKNKYIIQYYLAINQAGLIKMMD